MIRAVVVLPMPRMPDEQEGVGDPARGEGVLQRADQRLLADQLGQPGRAVGAGEDPVGGGALRLGRSIERPGAGCGAGGQKAGRRPGAKLVTAASFRT